MTLDEVRYERVDATSLVTIDRQHRRNAIDGRTADALVAALDRFEADEQSRVLVVTGAGEAFCSGAELTALETLSPRLLAGDGPLGFTRRVASKPAIAAIDGWAVAGGLELALWCHLRVVSPRSRLGCLERRFGVPLVDGGTCRLPRVVGLGRALDLILTGRVVGADEALAMDLVNEVADDPIVRALELAELITSHPQPTMLSDRASVYDGYGLSREDALALEGRYGMAVLDDGESGAARFAAGEGRGSAGVPPDADLT